MLDKLFMQVLDMSRTACIVILVVILARLLLKKAPKIISYSLWAVVLFRLLCPVSTKAVVSVVPDMESISQNCALTHYDEPISLVDAGAAAYRAVGDAINGGSGEIEYIPTTETDDTGAVRYAAASWWDIFVMFGKFVWLAGVAVMLLYSVISYVKIRRKLRVAVLLRYDVSIADDIQSPFVIGFISPRIYLPSGLSENEREYIIHHEEHHIARHDNIVKALAFLTLCIHWFNPLVWLAFVLASKDMEMSCDEAVIRERGERIRAEYSASLLALATGRRVIAGTPLAFGEGNAKDRIKNLGKWERPAVWVVIVAVCASLMLTVSLATNQFSRQERTLWFVGTVTELQTDDDNNVTALVIDTAEKGVGKIGLLVTEESPVFSMTGPSVLTMADMRASFQGESHPDWNVGVSCYRGKKKLTTADGTKITAYEVHHIDVLADLIHSSTTLRDGTQVSVMEYGFTRVYALNDGTRLLDVQLPNGPQTQYVGEENIFDDMRATAQWKVKAFYTQQGLLFDEQEILERVYALYQELGEDFQYARLEQSIVITESSDRVMYITTSVTQPVGIEDGNLVHDEILLVDAFDRETGEHIDTWDLFSAPEETVVKTLLDEGVFTEPPLRSELEAVSLDRHIILSPDSLYVRYEAGTLPSIASAYVFGVDYTPAIQELVHDWAVPKERD